MLFRSDKRAIHLDEPIKHLGEVTVQVRIHRDVTVDLRVVVVKEQDQQDGEPAADADGQEPVAE